MAFSSAGCTSETIKVLVVDAKPKDDRVKFEHGIVTGPINPDDGECIETLYVLEDKLYEELQRLHEDDHAIDARLMTWAFSSYVSRRSTRSQALHARMWGQRSIHIGYLELFMLITLLCSISNYIVLRIASRRDHF
ncbi:hypothetical protein LX36DRAFT_704087 [Colletotrichum falcatum]|nr:hypothetical protein LX36DRAFT_704087 [Colletotrichum falcatum]